MKKVAVIGASGMLGHVMLRYLAGRKDLAVVGSVRGEEARLALPLVPGSRVVAGVDVGASGSLERFVEHERPDILINCVGLIKQLRAAQDPVAAIAINALLPHRMARIAEQVGARLVHVSTDCVFSGNRGLYTEDMTPDATDLYGRSKLLGEVDGPHAITLRTSIIGPEIGTANGLIAWFLAQEGRVRGFSRAVFSGLPTVELARIVADHIIPAPSLNGMWHVSAEPINKLELLRLARDAYGKAIEIEPDDHLIIDRSLDSSRFRAATGWRPPAWPQLVEAMHRFG